MHVLAVVQARMGSTRLPGKVMLPLDSDHVLAHVVARTDAVRWVDTVVVATSEKRCDDIIARYTPQFGADIHRGSETDVLGRLFEAVCDHDADIVVRITADCPLIDPSVVDAVVDELDRTDADYAGNTRRRTFPRGLDVEAFTVASFERVHDRATEPHHREHVTPYYHEYPDEFDLAPVTSDDVYDDPDLQDRTDLRLTLDEAADYELLREIYDGVPYEGVLPVADAIAYVDEHDLDRINAGVEQEHVENASDDPS